MPLTPRHALACCCSSLLLAAACGKSGGAAADPQVQFKGPLPALAMVTYTDAAGDSVAVQHAYPGLVAVLAKAGTPSATVAAAAKAQNGTIIDSIPSAGIYTVSVTPGSEGALVAALLPQAFVVDASPAAPFMQAGMLAIDYLTGETGECEPHGQNVAAVMASQGQPVATVDLATDAFAQQLEPLPGLMVVGDWAPALARDAIARMEAAAAAGQRLAVNLSLQSLASGESDRAGTDRTTCNDPAQAGALDCKVVAQEQLAFLEVLYQSLETESAAVRANTALVIAAGNAGVPITAQLARLRALYPNASQSIQVVGGSDANGQIDTDFNHADSGMIYALGTDVPTVAGTTCSGTSFAAPEVTRILDELWRANPALSSDQLLKVLGSALATCPRTGGGANVVPSDANGHTQQAFLTCADALARSGPPTATTFRLTLSTSGGGTGTLSASPAGPTYPAGTVVTISEAAASSPASIFAGWTGACTGAGSCVVTMNGDLTVTGAFALVELFQGPYGGTLGTATDKVGCGYRVTIAGQLALQISQDAFGNVIGQGSASTTVTTAVTNTPANTTCSGGQFTTTPTGMISGTTANLSGTLVDDNTVRPYQLVLSGAWNGNTVTASVTASRIFHTTSTQGDLDIPLSATFSSLSLARQ